MTIKCFSLFADFTNLGRDFRSVKHPQILVPIDLEAYSMVISPAIPRLLASSEQPFEIRT